MDLRRARNAFETAAPWISVLGIILVVIWLHSVDRKAASAKAHAATGEAIRIAEKHAASHTRVEQCLASIPTLRKVNRFVHGVQTLHLVLARNARQTLLSTTRSDPLYRARLESYQRIRATVPAVSVIHFTIPTRRQCLARR